MAIAVVIEDRPLGMVSFGGFISDVRRWPTADHGRAVAPPVDVDGLPGARGISAGVVARARTTARAKFNQPLVVV